MEKFIKLCDELISKNVTKEDFEYEIINKQFDGYINLNKKISILSKIRTYIKVEFIKNPDDIEIVKLIEMCRMFFIVGCYLNINFDGVKFDLELYDKMSSANCDILVSQNYSDDYHRFIEMFNKMVEQLRYDNVIESLNNTNHEVMSENLDKILKVFGDGDNLNKMTAFLAFNNKGLDNALRQFAIDKKG